MQTGYKSSHAGGIIDSSIEGYSQGLKIIGFKQIYAEAPRHVNTDGTVLPRSP